MTAQEREEFTQLVKSQLSEHNTVLMLNFNTALQESRVSFASALSEATDKLDVRMIKMHETMREIAINETHSIVNGKFDTIMGQLANGKQWMERHDTHLAEILEEIDHRWTKRLERIKDDLASHIKEAELTNQLAVPAYMKYLLAKNPLKSVMYISLFTIFNVLLALQIFHVEMTWARTALEKLVDLVF